MFCSKCGKTIDDNAPFCGFCGAPTGVASNVADPVPQPAPQPVIPQNTVPQNNVPQYGAPQNNVPQYGAPQNNVPQYGAPQNNVPQYGAPQNGMPQQPQAQFGGAGFSLDAKMIDIINKSIRSALIVLSVLVIIGAIGSMAVAGGLSSALKTGNTAGLGAAMNAEGFYNLSRVPAIIAFGISILGLAFTMFTKQRSLFSYLSVGAGLLLFIFNFVMYGGYVSFATSLYTGGFSSLFGGSGGIKVGGIVVAGIFLLLGALAMIACSLAIILKKEDIIKFKPKF